MCAHKPESIANRDIFGKARPSKPRFWFHSIFAARRESGYLIRAMFFENRFRDNEPLTRIGNVPVYATTILVAALVAGLIIGFAMGEMIAASLLGFFPSQFWHGEVWRAVSYLIVGQINFFTLFGLLFLYSFGRDCEQELGRRRYLVFLTVLVATPVVFGSLCWFVGLGGGVVGSIYLSMGFVIAFATIYPNVEWFNVLPMKYFAVACMFLAAIGDLRSGNIIGVASMLATCAVSFTYIRAMRAGTFEGFTVPTLFRRKPKFRVVPKPELRSVPAAEMGDDDMDALLDKIAKSGMSSLTAKERNRLEKAREELLKKDRR
jgi:membrane associated rhomboid family serine protease